MLYLLKLITANEGDSFSLQTAQNRGSQPIPPKTPLRSAQTGPPLLPPPPLQAPPSQKPLPPTQ